MVETPLKSLRLYISESDYDTFRGGAWPDYEDFLQGARSADPAISNEIERFVDMMKQSGVRFPVQSKTACQSKWTWSTIYLNQLSTASCHRVDPVSFTLEQFDDFHNLPKKIQDRELMLEGQWPRGGCEYCQVIEDSGGWSDRQHNLEIRNLTPPELEVDTNAVRVSPRLVEIFAQNTCNMSCIYCNANLSSRIEHENKKHGVFEKNGVTIPVLSVPEAAPQYFSRWIKWLENNLHGLRRLHLLGGETFLQHDLMQQVLDVIAKRSNPDLVLNIFSNFNVPDKCWYDYLSQIERLVRHKHLARLDLTASIDCWGPEAEYTRFGLDLEKFKQKFNWAASQDPDWLNLIVNQTIAVTTIRSMPDLITFMNQYNTNRHIGHYWEFVCGPIQFLHPKILAWRFWQEDFDNIFESMPKATAAQLEAIQRMQGIASQLRQVHTHDIDQLHKLHVYLDELDRRRGTHWRSIFPYLDQVQ